MEKLELLERVVEEIVKQAYDQGYYNGKYYVDSDFKKEKLKQYVNNAFSEYKKEV